MNSLGGTIANGDGTPANDGRFRYFTVQNGTIAIQFQAPASAGTSVLQLLPAEPNGDRIGFQAFTVKSVSVGP